MALRESENRFRALITNSADGITLLDSQGRVLYDSPAAPGMLGYGPDDWIGQSVLALIHPDQLAEIQALLHSIAETPGARVTSTFRVRHKNASWLWLEAVATNLLAEPGVRAIVVNYRDITARKQAEAELEQERILLRTLIDNLPDRVYAIDAQGRKTISNKADWQAGGRTNMEDIIGKTDFDTYPPELAQDYWALERSVLDSGTAVFDREEPGLDAHGNSVWLLSSKVPLHDADGKVVGLVGVGRDITERKRAEDERQALTEIMQAAALTEGLQDFLELLRQSLSRVLDAENLFVVFHNKSTGLFEEVFAVDKYDAPMPPSRLERSITSYVYRTGQPLLLTSAKFAELEATGEVELVGTQQASWLGAPLRTPDGAIGVIAVQNYEDPDCYSERDKAFLASVASQVALAIERKQAESSRRESEQRYRSLFENMLNGFAYCRMIFEEGRPQDFIYLDVNRAFESLTGLKDVVGKKVSEVIPGIRESDPELFEIYGRVALTGKPEIFESYVEALRMWFSISVYSPQKEHFVAVFDVISARKRAEANIEKQLHRISALRAIDAAISSSMDMRVSLNILLAQTINELHVDAAAVLLFNNLSNELEYAAGVGFRGAGIAGLHLKPGEGYAGEAALERRMVIVPNMAEAARPFAMTSLVAEDKFVAFYAIPLVAKGQVKGVLELFHRSALDPDPEWLDFLDALAGQAAIAIDSAQLFADLQRSNTELALAYDSTIEGWSHAMDLRDKETEGHTQRVTDAAVKLGRLLRLSEQELVHLRRGALLHDMGKMGVPDAILLKPGPLTDEDWALMRQHPTFAYQMLAKVRYLEPAINVPYCHHEKWDGTGYPRGLMGEQIPLSARIFAVIDVYDALTSDRPYRPAWSSEKAQEYIRSESGKHFDPRVVAAFLNMIARERQL